ncbi:MAG: HD domain-containing protein [Lachnospiraceae bacterium]|nr:HD domain-containing protein [Lachnospiraceae bacterium]
MNTLLGFAMGFGIVLLLFNVVMSVYSFILRRDVITAGGIMCRVLAVIVILMAICIIYGTRFLFDEPMQREFILAFLFVNVLYTVLLLWVHSEFSHMKHHAMETLRTLIEVTELGDTNLDGHSIHVQNLTMAMYEYLPALMKLRINPENLRYASVLIDLGKLGIPRDILNRGGKLTGDEWSLVKRHPEIAASILKRIGSFDEIADWIMYHHERFDGTGYYKLKGNAIPLASRVIAVGDTFSALTMDRSYKATLTYEEAIAELKLVSGTQLDRELVDIFCSIPKSRIEECLNDVQRQMRIYGELGLKNALKDSQKGD